MGLLRNAKTHPLEQRMQEELKKRREAAERDPFGFAEYSHSDAERAGYSDYSYGRIDPAGRYYRYDFVFSRRESKNGHGAGYQSVRRTCPLIQDDGTWLIIGMVSVRFLAC